MTRSKIIGLRFPVGGINRRQGFQSQPPFTTVDCLNVRPDSVYGHRERGGSRPGTNPSHRGTLGSGNPVRMLANLDVIETTGLTYWQDTFDGDSMGSVWSKPSWITRLPEVESGVAYGSKRYSTSGAVRAAFATTIDTAKDYIVEMFIAPRGSVINGTYRLYLRMDNTTPDASSAGVTATLTIAKDGTFGGSLSVAGGSTYAFTAGDHGGVAAGWFSCRISGNNVSAYWRNSTLISSQAVGSHSGQRVGFSLATSDRVEPAIESFRVQYYLSGGNQRTNRRIVLASSNGSLYKEDFLGSTVAVSSSLTLASDRTIQAQQRLQKLYIADCGEWKSSGTDGARGTGNGKFDATGVTDWTTVGIDTDDDVLVIYDSSNTTTLIEGVYKISSVLSGELTLTTDCATGSGATCSWYITRSPKVYDYATNTLSQWTATTGKGFVPPTQPIICMYRDRLFLAGGSDSPHLWYMSRQGDPLDFDYGQEDAGRAVAGENSQAGIIGEPITAAAPHGDLCLVIGCKNSVWIMRGDPASGGQIDNLSRTIGIVDKFAWTYVPNVSADNSGTLVFLSLDGVYMLPAGCGASEPVSISREKVPEELLHVDSQVIEVQMAYDLLDRGVHIWLTKKDSGSTTHWWLDWETKGFFRVSVPATHQPTAVLAYSPFCAEDACVILGGRDGILRRFHKWSLVDDGGTEIESFVEYGPILLGDQAGYGDGILAEVQPMLGTDGGRVKLECRAGASAEQAKLAESTHSSIHVSDGAGYTSCPRVRGNAAFVKLSGVDGDHWTVENISARIVPGGRMRRL